MPELISPHRIRIAIICRRPGHHDFVPYHMSHTRWLRISEALVRRGHEVDMIVNTPAGIVQKAPGLRFVPLEAARWEEYDVVKTQYQKGFEMLAAAGGGNHPFIISRLASVVPRNEGAGPVYFHGAERERLYQLQETISRRSRYIAVNSRAEADLLSELTGRRDRVIIVPTGVDETIPPARQNPFARFNERIAVYLGNIRGLLLRYQTETGTTIDVQSQLALNHQWQERLNAVGGRLREHGIRLCFVGPGNVTALDPDRVTVLDPVPNDEIWDYHYFADVGIALAQGSRQHAECSKIYYYLRGGLPVVSEAPIPTNTLINETGHGLIVNYGNPDAMAAAIVEATRRRWNKSATMAWMVKHHTWDARARIYDALLRMEFGLGGVAVASANRRQPEFSR